MITSTRLYISFWVVLIIGLIVGWVANSVPLGDPIGPWIALYCIVLAIIVALVVIYVFYVRRVLKKSRLIAFLYIVIGLWPILLIVGIGALGAVVQSYNPPVEYVYGFLTWLLGPLEWTQLWLPFIVGSMLVMGSLVAQKARQSAASRVELRKTMKIHLIGLACLVLVLVLHGIIPSTAEMKIDNYLSSHYGNYTVIKTEWYHSCCMETDATDEQHANKILFTVRVMIDGKLETKYFGMGDTNRANEFNEFGGSQDWSTPYELSLDEAQQYRDLP